MSEADTAPPTRHDRSLDDMLAQMRGLSAGAALPRRPAGAGHAPAGDDAVRIAAELLDEALEQRLRVIASTIEESLQSGREELRREVTVALAGLAEEVVAGTRAAAQDDAALAERTVAAVQRRLDAATRQLDELLEKVERREARLPMTGGANGRGAAGLLFFVLAVALGAVGGILAAPYVEPYLPMLVEGW